MFDKRVGFHLAKLCDVYTVGLTNARQIVPQQIDNHHVFRLIFLALTKFIAAEKVGFGGGTTLAGSLNWSSLHFALSNANKPFRRGTQNRPVGSGKVTGKRSRIAST